MHPFMTQQIAEDTRRERLAASSAPHRPRRGRRASRMHPFEAAAASATSFVTAMTSWLRCHAHRLAGCD